MMALFWLLALPAVAAAQQYRAFWADAFHSGYKSPAEVDQMVADVAKARGNAIFVQMRRRADSYYTRTLEVPAQDTAYSPSFDALQYLIDRAHARGIEVHAWFVVYPLWPNTIAPPLNPDHVWYKHGPRASGEEMWMQVSAAGAIGSAFDPGHPGVQQYLARVILDPLEHYDIDGIHLDYIRYDETAAYGWNPKPVERFRRQELRAGQPDARDAAWADFRRAQVTALMRQIYLRAIDRKPRVKVSAALISWGNGPLTDAGFRSTDAFATVFQDWRAWLEEGILDLAMPMHYFRDSTNATFLDRWLAFSRDRQFRRGYLPGLAPYLNPIADSLRQLDRVLAPVANAGLGVAFYSYASTNTLNAAGLPVVPNDEFYTQVGARLGADAAPPSLPWKEAPALGHAMGWLNVEGGPEWLADGATVHVSSDTGKDFARTMTADGTGFFGFVDLPPDRYRARLERGGRTIVEATPQDVRAGAVTRFDFRLTAEDFAAVLPQVARFGQTAAAPGDIIAVDGRNFASAEAYAPGVPLPVTLGAAQVLVNGEPAPLFYASAERLVLQLPYLRAAQWSIVVRRPGLDSPAATLAWAAATPHVIGVNRPAGRYLEVYATGLGMVTPVLDAGRGADPGLPLPRVTDPVGVLVNGARVEPLYAGLVPYQPGIYQVNIALPEGVDSGDVRLEVGCNGSQSFPA